MEYELVGHLVRIDDTPRRGRFEVLRQGERIASGVFEFNEHDGLPDMVLDEGSTLSPSMRSAVHHRWLRLQTDLGVPVPRLDSDPP